MLTESLGFILNMAARQISWRLEKNFPVPLTAPQWGVLAILFNYERPLTIGEIARFTSQDAPTTARITTRLERDGYVTRGKDPRDLRMTKVALTPKSSALQTHLQAAALKTLAQATSGLTETEVNELKRMLLHIQDKLRRQPLPARTENPE
ncbi:MAG: MarR family transcriptional regulator [Peptococcaceae bacterium]|nr:MarR family transcriptional regulator [Peptococcaceae bacterium]